MGLLNNLLEVQAQSKGSEEAYKPCWCFLVTLKYLNSSGRISKDKEKKQQDGSSEHVLQLKCLGIPHRWPYAKEG